MAMTPRRIMRVKLVLLDANVIIESFRLGIWDKLIEKVEIIIANTIIDQPCYYEEPDTGAKKYIDLMPYIRKRKIKIVDCDIQLIPVIEKRCYRWLALHSGELESIAVVLEQKEDYYLCTADNAAIQAMVLIDMKDRIISFERLLDKYGVPRPKKVKLRQHFTEDHLKKWLKEGSKLRAETEELS